MSARVVYETDLLFFSFLSSLFLALLPAFSFSLGSMIFLVCVKHSGGGTVECYEKETQAFLEGI